MLQAVLADRPPQLPELRNDARADAMMRLAIYRNGYRVRLRDALAIEYPGLGLMMGRRFGNLLDRYVETHPSVHYNIRWHGAGIAAFLEYALPWRERPALAEMARLDWAISTAFDAADEPVLAAADLAGVPADAWANLRLLPQNHLQILSTHHNVEAFRRAADRNDKRPRLHRHDTARHLLVWRQALTVHYRSIGLDELSALHGAIKGEPFAILCELLSEHHDPAEALPRMAGFLHQWLADGLISRCLPD
ncbi:hypothetical protein B0E46_07015 [Rhodanobacter sp. B04]|nr:hypothetical protein B0E46_07015 [Rhodanobacter sp. B04]